MSEREREQKRERTKEREKERRDIVFERQLITAECLT